MRATVKYWVCVGALAALGGCSCQPGLPPDPNDDTSKEDTSVTTTEDTAPAPPCDAPEVEPNGSADEASSLPLEQIGCGVFEAPGDFDVFVTEVAEEGWLSFSTVATKLGSFADMQIVVSPSNGAAVDRRDDPNVKDASLLFPAPAGTYIIQLIEQSFQGGDNYHYEVVVSRAKAPVDWSASEIEPNNDLASAYSVGDGDALFGGMSSNTDSDWYRIDVPAGKHTLTATVDAFNFGSGGNFSLFLFDDALGSLPEGCESAGVPPVNCLFTGPLEGFGYDPGLTYESLGDEVLYVKISDEEFKFGDPVWYVIRFSLEGTP
ncbi:MAG: hypothetical protein GWP91_05035 [Rhodobacterales bacterium]|nr:hypothetical protein [Rhodobacterales bacterium]